MLVLGIHVGHFDQYDYEGHEQEFLDRALWIGQREKK